MWWRWTIADNIVVGVTVYNLLWGCSVIAGRVWAKDICMAGARGCRILVVPPLEQISWRFTFWIVHLDTAFIVFIPGVVAAALTISIILGVRFIPFTPRGILLPEIIHSPSYLALTPWAKVPKPTSSRLHQLYLTEEALFIRL